MVRWFSASVAAAVFVVGACFFSGAFAVFAEFLCAFGAAVVVPLALVAGGPSETEQRTPLERLSLIVVPVGGMSALASLTLPASTTAMALALPWLAATSTMALAALQRILRRGVRPLSEFAVDAGHVYVVVGAIWLTANRGAHSVMGFQEPVVLYTATHFHFAGCAAPVVAGLVLRLFEAQRGRASPLLRSGVVVVIGGIPLVAAGIVFTHALELPAAVLLALAMLIVMGALVAAGVRRLRGDDGGGAGARASGLLLVVAGLCLVLSMSLVVVFAATGSVTRDAAAPLVPYEWMVRLHGGANAIGFAFCALVALVWQPAPRRRHRGGSFPDVFFGGHVGVDVFDRHHRLAERVDERVVVGQLGRLEEFESDTFNAAPIDRRVRDFYERTADYALRVTPQWAFPFSVVAPVVVAVAKHVVGNCVLPLRAEREETVRTRLFALRDDGRQHVRGYVRSVDGAANFVAAYATHTRSAVDAEGKHEGEPAHTWLSVGLPLPWSWLVAVLRFENVGAERGAGGLAVTSHPRSDADVDDEGLFFVCRFGVVRLPLNERIEVFVGDDGNAAAIHVTRLCGIRVCTLRYRLLSSTTPAQT